MGEAAATTSVPNRLNRVRESREQGVGGSGVSARTHTSVGGEEGRQARRMMLLFNYTSEAHRSGGRGGVLANA